MLPHKLRLSEWKSDKKDTIAVSPGKYTIAPWHHPPFACSKQFSATEVALNWGYGKEGK